MHEVFKSVSEENSKYGQVEKVIEMLFSFLTLSRKASEHLVTISEALMNSNTAEELGSLEEVYSIFEKDVRAAIQERSLMKNVEVPSSNEGQLAGLLKTFLGLTYLIASLNRSSLNGPETPVVAENLKKISGVLVGEIAEFFTSGFNYSTALEKVVKVVASTVINSFQEASSLVENLDFMSPINTVIQKLKSKLIFPQILKLATERDGIQKAISYFLKMYSQNYRGEKSASRAVTDLFSEISLKDVSEQDLNVLLTVAKRWNGFLNVLGIILKLFDLTSSFTGEHLSTLSFLSDPVIQHAIELSLLGLFNKTTPLTSLLHLNSNQNWSISQGLFQTILWTFLNESGGNSNEIVQSVLKRIHDFDLPFDNLSFYEKHPEDFIILVEQWQNDQR